MECPNGEGPNGRPASGTRETKPKSHSKPGKRSHLDSIPASEKGPSRRKAGRRGPPAEGCWSLGRHQSWGQPQQPGPAAVVRPHAEIKGRLLSPPEPKEA